MSHMIEFRNGKAQFAFAGEACWHGLGTNVPADLSPDQIQKVAGLDWQVDKVPLFANVGEVKAGTFKKLPTGHSALVRSDDNEVLDVITSDWNPCQNDEAFQFFNDFIAAGDMTMETAGSLRGGKTVFALAKVKSGFSLSNGDSVESYMLFTNPHEYGKSIDIRFTPVRVVCQNTMSMALGQKANKLFRQGHRTVFNADKAKLALGIAQETLDKYRDAAEYLSSKSYTVESMTEYFSKLFPITGKNLREKEVSRNVSELLEIVDVQPGHDLNPGTWWQAFNAVTFYTDHVAGHGEAGKANDNRAFNALYGRGADLKQEALKTAIDFANAA